MWRIVRFLYFEFIDRPGEYLHRADAPPSSTTFEVNCSATKTSWTLNLFRGFERNDKEYVGGGTIVRLFHSASSSFLGTDSVGRSLRWIDALPYSSDDKSDSNVPMCDTHGLWIVENLESQEGHFLRWGTSFRLRHAASARYLCCRIDAPLEDRRVLGRRRGLSAAHWRRAWCGDY